MNRAPWLRTAGTFALRRVFGVARSSRLYRLVEGEIAPEAAVQAEPPAGDAPLPAVAGLSIDDELAANQARFPFPKWAIESSRARTWILAAAARGGVGAEIGVYRGHFSEVILATLAPRKFYMIDPWTAFGEFFSWADDYTNNGKLPTALARREAQLRAAKFPDTEALIIENTFPDCIAQIDERLDWIYIDSSHRYKETLIELKAAASILKPDGVILGDDYYPDRSSRHHGVFRAVNEFVKIAPFEFVAAGPAAQWCLRRTNIAAVAVKGQRSIAGELAANQARFPFPARAANDIKALQSVLDFASPGTVGAEVGAFRGHFSEVVLARLVPRKFFMIDAWTKAGEFFAVANGYSNNGELPTKLARREAQVRAAKFPNSETVLVDDAFSSWAGGAAACSVDWVYLHAARDYRQSLLQLAEAARILKPDGVIMGDGYYPDGACFDHGTFRAVTEFVGATPYEFVSVGQAGQWCMRRK
jgi:SAM-dependent methyltransferase